VGNVQHDSANGATTSAVTSQKSQGHDSGEVIVLDNVRKAYGDVVAVKEAQLTINRGEFFSLLGPSGCGKTTILRMIAGFEQPTSGRILLEGVDVSRVAPHKRNVNTVFQQYALFPHMSVFDNVAFGPRNKKVKENEITTRVNDILEIVRLSEFANRRPHQLSGGQQQRVALARALVNYPSALLLDEPLAALDLKLREAMQIELKRIQKEVGITFIFVTHDQGEALAMSDRIAVMSEGRIEQVGTPEEIYQFPSSLFVAGFIGSANLFPGIVSETGLTIGGRSMITVSLRDGTSIKAFSRVNMKVGDDATVMVRPERVQPVALSDAQQGRGVIADVSELVFQGSVIRCLARTAEGLEIVGMLDAMTDLSAFRAGSRICMSWPEAVAYALPGRSSLTGSTTTNLGALETSSSGA
jgi:spermidine/putrescine transport system ATP-binding protein